MGSFRQAKNKKTKLKTLDLHGMSADEAFDAIEKFLNSPGTQKQSKVRIMTGKGKGILKKVAQDYLKQAGYPYHAEKMDNGQMNDGVLVVVMD